MLSPEQVEELIDDLIIQVDKVKSDMGFAPPELMDMRWNDLKHRIALRVRRCQDA